MTRLLNRLTSAFPVWVFAASVLALYHPPLFTWFTGAFITLGLGFIMLGMGLTMSVDDFRGVARHPLPVFCGILLQYTAMPLLGWGLAYLFRLPNPFAVGLILVSCCPGGTASNVITFLARADLSLSVSMTSISTLLAALMTPTLTALLAGSRIDVPAWGLLLSTVQVVILPVVLGLLMKRYCPRVTGAILPGAPLAAVALITLIVASIIGAGKQEILSAGPNLLLAILSLHAGGFLLGYILSRVLRMTEMQSRTIAIEVGMQNSGLGVVLARQNFASPLFAIPSAISSLCHSLIGSLAAAIWRRSGERYCAEAAEKTAPRVPQPVGFSTGGDDSGAGRERPK